MERIRNLGLVVTMSLSLAACKSETSKYEGEWESTTIKGLTMEIDFEQDGDHHLMKMTGTMNGVEEISQLPVEIKEDGIYAINPLGIDPVRVFWIMKNGQLTSMAGDFKR